MTQRIVVYTGNLAYSVRKGIDAIDRALPGTEWLVLVHAPRKSLARLLRNQWANLKRNGWRWIPYQLGDIAGRIGQRLRHAHPHSWRGVDLGQDALASRPNLTIRSVADIHGEAALAEVRAFAPDLGLSLAAPILRRSLFGLPRLGTLNLHKGRVPHFRGMPPAFWELWNGEASVGCTVHWVDDKLDTGAVAGAAELACAPYSTVKGMQLRLDETGIDLMRDVVGAVFGGRAQAQAQAAGGATYRKPTLAQAAALDARLLGRQPPGPGLLPRLGKQALSLLALGAWRAGLGRLLAPRVTVLLYHRVSDDARDNLTVGIEQFDRQMALLRAHCEVLSIEQVAALRQVPRSGRPLVCVTFDDGYLDNYENAAQVLLRHQVPAAFFVSTGLIGTRRTFPHDVRRGNAPIPMMDWDQLRAMRAAGFTIGSHTVEHIDCAAEPEALVRAELAASRDTLRRELGLEHLMFAYPYGGRRHMTAQRLELVKEAGYSACLSAYGGVNIGGVDAFNVVRRGIHWEFSDLAFRIECLGLKK